MCASSWAVSTRRTTGDPGLTTAVDGRDAITRFQDDPTDLVITDMRMPHADGLDVLRAVKARAPLVEVIVLTGYATLGNAVSALRNEGAFNYLTKPLEDIEELLTTVRNALERQSAATGID